MKKTCFIFIFLFVIFNLPAQKSNWVFDQSNCSVQFNVVHMGIAKVTGWFNNFGGEITNCSDDFSEALITFFINSSSLSSNNTIRDNHLKSPEFLAVTRYPYINFKGSGLKKMKDNLYKLQGKLTIKGVEKEVEFDVRYGGTIIDKSGSTRAGFDLSGTINRFDYRLEWNELIDTTIPIVDKNIEIICRLQLVKTKK